MQGLSMFNIMYADRNDTIFYINNALMPVRDTASSIDWKSTVPGNGSKTLWTSFHRIGELPQYVNPKSGFLFNSNHSSFLATGPGDNLSASAFPRQNGWETDHNNRSVRFLELMPQEGRLDFEQFKRIKFDRQYPSDLQFPIRIDTLFRMNPAEHPAYDTLLRNLQQWDRRGEADSKGAGAFLMVYESVSKRRAGRLSGRLSKAECLAVLEDVRSQLISRYGTTDVALGDIQKLVRGSRTYPSPGLPDLLAPEWSVPYQNGTRKVSGGDAYIAFVRFPKQGLPIIESSNTYGASSRPDSPHFDDQVPLFLGQKTKHMTMDREEIFKNAKRIYHPGDL
jgi:acyl-homoserine-lactone acylase